MTTKILTTIFLICSLASLLNALNIPHQGSIEHKGEHICGATIISLSTMLTAAHCVQGKDIKDLVVRAGTIKRGQNGKTVQIGEMKIHPDFQNETLDYDLAILIAKEPFQSYGLVTEFVGPIELQSNVNNLNGKIATVSGWGYDDSDDFTETLMYVELPILERSVCEKYVKMTDRKICGGYLEGGKGTCHGDAGGPVTVDNILVGIVSSDDSCGRPNKPDTFTDTRVLSQWIKDNQKN